MDLNGAIDLHVHCAPDTRPRKMTAHELLNAARGAGMRGLLLKNHDTPTTAMAAVLAGSTPGFEVFGGLVLNEATGGFNPSAVDTAIRMGAKQIWMPTHCAAQECAFRGKAGTGLRAYDDFGFVPVIAEIIKLVAEAGIILGSGHLAPNETQELIALARDFGCRKFLVTHPEIDFVRMPVAMQKELAQPGVYFERCYARKGFALDWDGLAASIRAVGVESTVLATDLGQPENPDPVSGFWEMKRRFAERGFREAELRRMMCENPARLLGLC